MSEEITLRQVVDSLAQYTGEDPQALWERCDRAFGPKRYDPLWAELLADETYDAAWGRADRERMEVWRKTYPVSRSVVELEQLMDRELSEKARRLFIDYDDARLDEEQLVGRVLYHMGIEVGRKQIEKGVPVE